MGVGAPVIDPEPHPTRNPKWRRPSRLRRTHCRFAKSRREKRASTPREPPHRVSVRVPQTDAIPEVCLPRVGAAGGIAALLFGWF